MMKRFNERITPLDLPVCDYIYLHEESTNQGRKVHPQYGARIFLTRYTIHTQLNFVPQTAKNKEF